MKARSPWPETWESRSTTFVKIANSCASRADMLPPAY